MKFGTRAIHAGNEPDAITGAIMTPVYLTSTYVQEEPGKPKDDYDYARTKHPTRLALEKNIASLEDGKFGLCFASGLAAETAILSLLKSGDHIISCEDLYGGTYRLFTKVFDRFNITTTFFDATDSHQLKKLLKKETKMLWIESPTNPLLTVYDIEALTNLAHQYNLLVVLDNTFATSYLQQPLKFGVDIVIHSTTKYLGGHSDVVGGAIVVNDEKLFQELKFLQNAIGAIPGPLDCFLVLRGIKTLHVRMKQHCENARQIAQFLVEHYAIEKVFYPGLDSHSTHKIACKQMKDFGGMISFSVKGGIEKACEVTKKTKLFKLAESLGGVESLISIPSLMTHASMPKDYRDRIGIPEGLIRLSVGIEDIEDLIEDLKNALSKF